MTAKINIIDCEIKDYSTVLAMQEKALQGLLDGSGEDTILIVEHLPVITLGARAGANKLLKDSDVIKKTGIEIIQIRRGGGTTAHNPGQIVIYPIINLKKHNLGVSEYVHLLEKIGIEFLAEFGVKSETKKGFPGLWVKAWGCADDIENKNPLNPRNPWLKIASIGVQIKKWITFHGIAININNDLSIFDLIVPCGLENVTMTSAEKVSGKKIDMKESKKVLKKFLLKYFDKND